MRIQKRFLLLCVFIIFLARNIHKVLSNEVENQSYQEDNIVLETLNLKVYYSEKETIKAIGNIKKVVRYKNDDIILPEGIDIIIYKENQQKSANLTANYVTYVANQKIVILQGNVILKSCSEDRQLYTEELHYNIDSEVFNTDKPIKINNEGEILLGDGLQASKDLSTFNILNPQGNVNTEITD